MADFLSDIFCGLLGYTDSAESADTLTSSRERHVEVDGKVADVVLGRFQKDTEQFVAVLEGKGARDPPDRPFAGRRMSAVDPAHPPTFTTRYGRHADYKPVARFRARRTGGSSRGMGASISYRFLALSCLPAPWKSSARFSTDGARSIHGNFPAAARA